MRPLTRKQRLALLRVYNRSWGHHEKPSYTQFRRGLIRPYENDPCVMVKWHGIRVEIEADGHAHT